MPPKGMESYLSGVSVCVDFVFMSKPGTNGSYYQ